MGNEKPPADRGRQEKEQVEQNCGVCGGTGKLKKDDNTYVECKRCKGSGTVVK